MRPPSGGGGSEDDELAMTRKGGAMSTGLSTAAIEPPLLLNYKDAANLLGISERKTVGIGKPWGHQGRPHRLGRSVQQADAWAVHRETGRERAK